MPAPTNFGCSVNGNQINLSWTDNSTGETGFKMDRSPSGCGSFSQIGTTASNATSYSDSGLPNGTNYCYQVRAYTSYLNSSYSGTTSCTTKNPPVTPSGFSATTVSATQINLAWTDTSSNEAGFQVRRATGSSCDANTTVVATTDANVISYSDTSLAQGTKYCYVVCSYNSDGSACASSATATTTLPAPTGFSYGTIGYSSIIVNWTDNSTGETGFKIERSSSGCSSGFSQIGTALANVGSYTDASLSCSGTNSYCYQVRAYTADTNSSYVTGIASKATLPCSPSNLSASVSSPTQINLSWSDVSGNESGFKVEQKIGSGGTYGQAGTTAANAQTYNVTGLSDGAIYYFRVRPYDGDGDSPYSNEVYATTTLATPSNFTCTVISSSQINLAWTDNATNNTGIKIERANSSPPTTEVATLGKVASYSDTNLKDNTKFYYRIRAYNPNIYSSYTNECSATTLIYIPHGYFESSIFDVGTNVAFNNITWQGTLPNSSHVRFQFASAASSDALVNPTYLGPDGTASTYYEPTGPGTPVRLKTKNHNNHRYFRYKVFVYPTSDNLQTPTISEVNVGYSP